MEGVKGDSKVSGAAQGAPGNAVCDCKGIRTCLRCEGKASQVQGEGSFANSTAPAPVLQLLERRQHAAEQAVRLRFCVACGHSSVEIHRLPSTWRYDIVAHPSSGHASYRRLDDNKGALFCLGCDGFDGSGTDMNTDVPPRALARTAAERRNSERYGHAVLFASRCFKGAHVVPSFLSSAQEEELLADFCGRDWRPSQSGRRKQDYGPKVNFKKQKVRYEHFQGLPAVTRSAVEALTQHEQCKSIMQGFLPVELGVIEYDPEHGAAIDPHIDDEWIWGERIATLSLASDTIMTFSLEHQLEKEEEEEGEEEEGGEKDEEEKHFWGSGAVQEPENERERKLAQAGETAFKSKDEQDDQEGSANFSNAVTIPALAAPAATAPASSLPEPPHQSHPSRPVEPVEPPQVPLIAAADNSAANSTDKSAAQSHSRSHRNGNVSIEIHIHVPLPRRSLLVMSGQARHRWCHGIQREHIRDLRVSATFRELAPPFLPGGTHAAQGADLRRIGAAFVVA